MSNTTINLNGGEPIYLLLGEDACREYAEGGCKAVMKAYNKNHLMFDTITINHNDDLFTLLESMDGWGDWGIISKKDYERLNK